MESSAQARQLPPSIARARTPRILISAGEASGDLHGADLVREILAIDPRCEISGIAGTRMCEAGVKPVYRIEDVAGLGVTELRSTIFRTLGALTALRRALREGKPDLLILIDFAEFNMVLARYAKKAGVPVLYYITPQVWAWRRGRVRKIVNRADRLAVVLPFELELYAAAGERVSFVGHPLLDRARPAQDRAATLAHHGLAPDSRLMALLPGSRRREIRYLLGPMVSAAKILAKKRGLVPCLALAHTIERSELVAGTGVDLDGITVIENDTYSIVAASDVALVASGTATLETALLGCPLVIAYKMAPLTYIIARLLVTGVDYIGMPNILAGREIAPELIQGQVTAENLARAAEPLLDEPRRGQTRAALAALRARLGAPGAAARVAAMAFEMVAQ